MIGSNRFQNGSLIRVKNRNTPDTWFFRYYEYAGNRRVYRKIKIGTIRELPRRADVEKVVLSLRVNVNSTVRLPETVTELIAHYKKHELSEDSEKRFSTRSVYTSFLKNYVEPEWGRLSDPSRFESINPGCTVNLARRRPRQAPNRFH